MIDVLRFCRVPILVRERSVRVASAIVGIEAPLRLRPVAAAAGDEARVTFPSIPLNKPCLLLSDTARDNITDQVLSNDDVLRVITRP